MVFMHGMSEKHFKHLARMRNIDHCRKQKCVTNAFIYLKNAVGEVHH